jgi:hypothetical protein
MARNIVILLVCAVLVFVLVWRVAPGVLATALPFPTGKSTVAEDETKPATPEKATHAHKAFGKAPNKGDAKARPPAAASMSEAPASASMASIQPVVSQSSYQAFAHKRPHVSKDGATLYSSNASTGRVIGILKKDDPLELHFKVDNGGQEWIYVNAPEQRVSGFLSSDSLVE